jgi:acyl carrier protein
MVEEAAYPQPSIEEVEAFVIRALRLDEVDVKRIDPDEPLFGSGLGLDSIDALELALAVSKEYGVTIRSEDPNIRQIFASLRDLAAHIQAQRETA